MGKHEGRRYHVSLFSFSWAQKGSSTPKAKVQLLEKRVMNWNCGFEHNQSSVITAAVFDRKICNRVQQKILNSSSATYYMFLHFYLQSRSAFLVFLLFFCFMCPQFFHLAQFFIPQFAQLLSVRHTHDIWWRSEMNFSFLSTFLTRQTDEREKKNVKNISFRAEKKLGKFCEMCKSFFFAKQEETKVSLRPGGSQDVQKFF